MNLNGSNMGKPSKNNTLKEIMEKYALLAENIEYSQEIAQMGSWTYDIRRNKIFFTRGVYNIFETDSGELDGDFEKYYSYIHPDDYDMVKNAARNARNGIRYDIEYRIITKSGNKKYIHERTKIILDENNNPTQIIGVIQDVTEEKQLLFHLSNHDKSTGLPNKLYFESKLADLVKAARENGNKFAVYMMNIDSHRYIKNTLGFDIVEQFIINIAKVLRSYCEPEKLLFRYSDNRFVIIVPGSWPTDEYDKTARDIYKLFSQPIKIYDYEFDVEISMGISLYNKDAKDFLQLVRHAETALSIAKSGGKNRYVFYSADLNMQSYKHFILRRDLRHAIKNNQMKIYYQPIVNLKTSEILAAEALIRWEHPQWGLISPLEFIPIAEETGDIIQIGKWLLKEVCRKYMQWMERGLPFIKVSVNYSGMQFFEYDFVDKIRETIDEYGLNPEFLIIEITESVFINNKDKVLSDLKKLQSIGVKIALDDFGAGYSSLSYLADLSIDIIKIDGSFIKNINISNVSTVLTRYIIKIAQDLKIKLVAEHIETTEQLNFLLDLNCYAGQGYLFCKPVPLIEFEKILESGKCCIIK